MRFVLLDLENNQYTEVQHGILFAAHSVQNFYLKFCGLYTNPAIAISTVVIEKHL